MQEHEEAIHHTHMLSLARAPDQRCLRGHRNEVRDDRREWIECESFKRVLATHAERRRVDERVDPREPSRLIPAERAQLTALVRRRGDGIDEALRSLDGAVGDEHVVAALKLEHAGTGGAARTENEDVPVADLQDPGALETLVKAEPIGVVADEAALAADHGVDGAD